MNLNKRKGIYLLAALHLFLKLERLSPTIILSTCHIVFGDVSYSSLAYISLL